MSEIRPFRLPGSSALATVLQRTRAALTTWANDWLVDAQPLAALTALRHIVAQGRFWAFALYLVPLGAVLVVMGLSR